MIHLSTTECMITVVWQISEGERAIANSGIYRSEDEDLSSLHYDNYEASEPELTSTSCTLI